MAYNKKPVISLDKYFNDAKLLLNKIDNSFSCIVCLKRSGFILGAYYSNQLTLPLFVPSEIKTIPDYFTKILVVDDKVCTGKSMHKIINKITKNKEIITACLYIQGDFYTDLWVEKLDQINCMFYENNNRFFIS